MPAVRERIYICPDQNGQPGWILELPIWWNRQAFFDKYGRRQFDTGNPTYVDYAFLLTGWEAAAWDRLCREQFALDPRSKEAFFVEAMHRLEPLLKAASWVIVESYEWESGLS
jgi:hypothetical protein